jgi:hypothetical protein
MRARSRLWEGTPPSYLDGKERWSDANSLQRKSEAGFGWPRTLTSGVAQISYTVAIIGRLIFVLYAAEHYTDSLVTRLQ